MPTEKVETTLTAENTFSDHVHIKKGYFSFSLTGTFVADVHVQRAFVNTAPNWRDVRQREGKIPFQEPIEIGGFEPEGALYRFGIKTGNFTSGSVTGRISQYKTGRNDTL